MEVWVERHVIRSSDPLYKGLLEDANAGTHLYNRAIYILRQAFTDHHENIQEYADLIKDSVSSLTRTWSSAWRSSRNPSTRR